MTAFIFFNWSENYGDAHAQLKQSFITAWISIKTGKLFNINIFKLKLISIQKITHILFKLNIEDRKVLFLGLIQSLFEGSMYVFVLEWTPALTIKDSNKQDSSNPPIPHGFIFAAYMVKIYFFIIKNFIK